MHRSAKEYTCERADAYVNRRRVPKEERPLFHLTAPVGWINDPNGFSVYGGLVHMFYQFHPYSAQWGPMHWGHQVSQDLIRWEERPTALSPNSPYDFLGCFSGTAIETKEGQHALLYTGVTKRQQTEPQPITDQTVLDRQQDLDEIEDPGVQNQCLALGDGVHYTKHEANPVVVGDELPVGYDRVDFRDPKVWLDGDTYYMLCGNRDETRCGQVVLFSSADLLHWQYECVLAHGFGNFQGIWECPDFFALDGKQVLIVSPQDLMAERYGFHSGNNAMAFVGEYDKETHAFAKSLSSLACGDTLSALQAAAKRADEAARQILARRTASGAAITEAGRSALAEMADVDVARGGASAIMHMASRIRPLETAYGFADRCPGIQDAWAAQLGHPLVLDYGLDFYAPETTELPDGRRVMMGWMQSWDSTNMQPQKQRWNCQMTLPRELHVKDGRLIQTPVKELENYRKGELVYQQEAICGERQLEGVCGRTADIQVTLYPGDFSKFTVDVAHSEQYTTTFTYEPGRRVFGINRMFSGLIRDEACLRELQIPAEREGQPLKLRFILDRNSVEVFVNDGEQVMSSVLYTPQDADQIVFAAEGKAVIDVQKFDICVE